MAGLTLNAAQREAVESIDGPCLVLAGAGSGKTRVITEKIVKLCRGSGLPPSRICALTFTNKAAAEMRERAAKALPPETAAALWISTFHSLGLEILRLEHRHLGLNRNFSLFDEQDCRKALRDILRSDFADLLRDSAENEILDQAQSAVSLWKGRLLAPDEIPGRDSVYGEIYAAYQQYLQACSAVDFDDLIFLTTRALQRSPQLKERWEQCFYYVLVDEYQDTNETQYQLLKLLTAKYRRFTVVGDDDQSIYSWRGARPENIKTLAADFPDLKVIKLEQNYRSSKRILHCANALIANNPHLFAKTLYSELPEGEKIEVMECRDEENEAEIAVSIIKGLRFSKRLPWHDFAILYRSNFQSRYFEKLLLQSEIPCRVSGGTGFFAQSEVKDIMAWCRLLANPQDDSALLRIINVPRRGIGTDTLQKLTETARLAHQSLFDCAMSGALNQKLAAQQRQALGDFIILTTRLRTFILSKKDLQLAQQLPDLIGYSAYLSGPRVSKAQVEFRMGNVRQICSWIGEIIKGRRGEPPQSFAKAVEKLGLRELMERRGTEGEEEDAVQLMTLHASKGLEFPVVILAGMEENLLPHRSCEEEGGSDEEERRLAYVGITRAQRRLFITLCKTRRQRGELSLPKPSRFLAELPQEELILHKAGEKLSLKISREEHLKNFDTALADIHSLLS